MSHEEDRIDTFYEAMGHCLETARLARLTVRVELDDGSIVEGVPQHSPLADEGTGEIDHSGTRFSLRVDGETVALQDARAYTLERPR